jgi:Tfp pilus assembly protein PilO
MREYLARLKPMERRFVVGVMVLLFVVLNIFWVWPRFSDWGNLKRRLDSARLRLRNFEAVIQQRPALEKDLARLEGHGLAVAPEDQATEFFRVIQNQAMQNGVGFIGNSRPTSRTNNQFFVEQMLTVQVQATEDQLVTFLYNLGSDSSMIRVRSLSVHPEQSRQQLSANITLVASYQKKPKTTAAAPATGAQTTPSSSPPPTAKPATTKPTTAKPAEAKPAAAKPAAARSAPATNAPAAPKPATPKKK